MVERSLNLSRLFVVIVLALAVTGCARWKNLERVNREQAATIAALKSDIAKLNDQLEALSRSTDELAQAKVDLERKLKGELAEGDLALQMGERGLVVSVLDRVLFDSGKAELKESARQTLDKVAETINQALKTNIVYVEGHTDNEPISYSGWRSNWELSTARATEVIHYFIDANSISPEQLTAVGYGEFRPVADNASVEGRSKNRRVEIIISPKKLVKRELKETAQPGVSAVSPQVASEVPEQGLLK